MKVTFKNKLLAVALITALSIPSSFGAHNAQYYPGANTSTKKAIISPGYSQFGSDRVSNLYMCSHTALKIALKTFGVTKSLREIHADLQKTDKKLNYSWDYSGKDKVCPWGSCPHIGLMQELLWEYDRQGLGVTGTVEVVSNAHHFNARMKQIISEGKVAVVLSRTYNFGRGTNYAHWYVVHGHRTENGKNYLYVRDPMIARSSETDEHMTTVEEWWKHMNRNGKIQFLRVGRP